MNRLLYGARPTTIWLVLNKKILFFLKSFASKLVPLITVMSEDQMHIDLIQNISLKVSIQQQIHFDMRTHEK